jgi:hypothetical protein
MLIAVILNLKKWLRNQPHRCNQPQTDKPHANKLSKKVPDPERNAMDKYPPQDTPVYVNILSSLTVLRTLILLVSHPHLHPQSNTIRRMGEETRVLSLKPARGHHPSPIPRMCWLLTPLLNPLRRCFSPYHIPRQCHIRRLCHLRLHSLPHMAGETCLEFKVPWTICSVVLNALYTITVFVIVTEVRIRYDL